ncbi:diaminopimelate decarboxylase [Anaerosolibacter carboniphilus]|uniref:Diaminopimelate decarboxylase n=1 Tax=Anaerosolibacter carboniphilus TaxID=1417629 RepID=A0A841L7D1_9FIRM|nr:diaminopimelate decarboxylase [Anaerosolibacter carboniphilus]MBB6218982.1 diaminopimelate decarboxylase [Anaerosolibacter carboniphilus]
MENESRKKKHLTFGGCDTIALAEKYGTPLYVMDEQKIRSKCREIQENFLGKYENTRAVYASKAFLNMTMCKIIESEGIGLDVVSGGELFTAIQAGFPTQDIIFHGNNKSYEELSLAVKYDVGRVVVDNTYELEMLQKIAKSNKKKVRILFRIAPGIEGSTHKYISTGQKDSKFGIPLAEDQLNHVVAFALKASHLELMGFHFHLGSQLFENGIYVAALDVLAKLMKDMKERYGFVSKELNAGGGFGIFYVEGDQPKPLRYFTDQIMEKVKTICHEMGVPIPQVIIEPGRWMVAEAGLTLYTIGAIKDIPGVRTYVSVDGGMPDNPRPALYSAKYQADIANKMNLEKVQKITVAGKCCETGDILIWDLMVPPVKSGDILAVYNTGAYNYSMASNYNRLPRPPVVLVNEGIDHVIVRRETYEDLLHREEVPMYLQKKVKESSEII